MKFDENLLPDNFSRQLFNGSLQVSKDKENPVRLHLFAAGFRELFTYILHLYAPDAEVRACRWFKQATDTPTITRMQRATYATQGGLSDDFIASLGLDINHLHRTAMTAMEHLNKATHVKPENIITEDKAINEFIDSAVEALKGLLRSFQICRDEVVEALSDQLYSSVAKSFVTKTFDQIDILAGKGYEVDTFMLDTEINVKSITSKEIIVKFKGIAPVTLHYGKGEDAAAINHDFPFWMEFRAAVEKPQDLQYAASYFDDRSWFE